MCFISKQHELIDSLDVGHLAQTLHQPLAQLFCIASGRNLVAHGVEKIAEEQVTKRVSHGTYQLNPFNGMWYHLKTEKDRFSTLVQGTGSYVLDLWLAYQFNLRNKPEYGFDDYNVKLLATIHDEQIVEYTEGQQDMVEKLMKDSLEKVNKRFNLEIPFNCDVQYGKKYADIH